MSRLAVSGLAAFAALSACAPSAEPASSAILDGSAPAAVSRAPCPSSPYASLQAAIDAAPASGGSIRVCDGVFTERLTVKGKFIDLRSFNGADATVLDANFGGSAITVTGGGHLVLVGFTVKNGKRNTGHGGAVTCDGSRLVITESRLANNRAAAGGAVATSNCEVHVYDTEFIGNTATVKGGGLYVNGGSWGSVRDATFLKNQAPKGGGLYASGSLLVDYSEFDGNAAQFGGGAWLNGASEFDWNHLHENTASVDGGGMYLNFFGGSVEDNDFARNFAVLDGGAIFVNGGDGMLRYNSYWENHADDDGGALRVLDSTTSIHQSMFLRNAADAEGGAVKISKRPADVRGNVFVDNVSGWRGGALVLTESASSLTFNRFERNEAQSGGALHISGGEDSPLISDGSFIDNAATNAGGHVRMKEVPTTAIPTFTRVLFTGGFAPRGGAIATEWAPVQVYNSVFDGNTATESGGALHVTGSNGGLVNCVAFDNAAPDGAAITVASGRTLRLHNTAFVENDGGAAIRVASGTAPYVKYNDFYGNTARFSGMPDVSSRDGNLTAAPGFVDPANGDFHLTDKSALIDAGDPAIVDPDGTRSDIGRYGGPSR